MTSDENVIPFIEPILVFVAKSQMSRLPLAFPLSPTETIVLGTWGNNTEVLPGQSPGNFSTILRVASSTTGFG